jgi:hypothetical protein
MALLMSADVSAWANDEPAAAAARMLNAFRNADISITSWVAELVCRRLVVKVWFK